MISHLSFLLLNCVIYLLFILKIPYKASLISLFMASALVLKGDQVQITEILALSKAILGKAKFYCFAKEIWQ